MRMGLTWGAASSILGLPVNAVRGVHRPFERTGPRSLGNPMVGGLPSDGRRGSSEFRSFSAPLELPAPLWYQHDIVGHGRNNMRICYIALLAILGTVGFTATGFAANFNVVEHAASDTVLDLGGKGDTVGDILT